MSEYLDQSETIKATPQLSAAAGTVGMSNYETTDIDSDKESYRPEQRRQITEPKISNGSALEGNERKESLPPFTVPYGPVDAVDDNLQQYKSSEHVSLEDRANSPSPPFPSTGAAQLSGTHSTVPYNRFNPQADGQHHSSSMSSARHSISERNVLEMKHSLHNGNDSEVIATKDLTQLKESCIEIYDALQFLKNEYEQEQKNVSGELNEEKRYHKSECIGNMFEKVLIGLEEIEIFIFLTDYLTKLELHALKYPLMIQYLDNENQWLRCELETINDRYAILDSDYQINDLLRRHYQDLCHLRKNEIVMKKDNKRFEVDLFDLGGDVPDRLKGVYHMVKDYVNHGQYDVAIALAEKTFREVEQEQEEADGYEERVLVLNIMALIYREKGDYLSAVESLEKALHLREKYLGVNNVKLAGILNNIAVLHGKRNDFHSAELHCRRSLELRKDHLGNDNPEVAKQYNNLALIIQNTRESPEVEELFLRAIVIYRKCGEKNYVKTMNNLSAYYLAIRHYADAENCTKRVMDVWHEESYGMLHVETRKLYEMIERHAATQSYAPFVSQFSKLGRVTNPTYKTAIRLLMQIYKATDRQREVDLLMEYIRWCQQGSISNKQASMRRSRVPVAGDAQGGLPIPVEGRHAHAGLSSKLKRRWKKLTH